MKEIEVFDGNTLHDLPVEYPVGHTRCVLCGQDASGGQTYVRMDEELLSRHMMLLGGIGTGKTNALLPDHQPAAPGHDRPGCDDRF